MAIYRQIEKVVGLWMGIVTNLNTVWEPSQCTADAMQTMLIHILLRLCRCYFLLANSF